MNESGGELRGKEVAFTGRLASMSRRDAVDLVRARGGEFVSFPRARTTFLVVGQEGWPLQEDGRLTRKVERARELRQKGFAIAVLEEEEFLRILGFDEASRDIHRLFTLVQLARILGVPAGHLRRWLRRGLIRPARTAHRLAYFDFREVAGAKRLWELLQAGVPLERIRRSLEQLRRSLPAIREPLLQLSALERGGRLFLRLDDGQLADPRGQLYFSFMDKGMRDGGAPLEIPARAPRSADEWFALAVEREEDGRLREAEEAYREALLAGGPAPETCFNLGNVLYALGKRGEAAERFRQAVELDGAYVEAWNNLGNLLAELGDVDAAIRAYRRALRIEPRYADAHYNLADALNELGEIEEARAHWEAYLREDPRSSWAERVRARLRGEG